MFVGAKSLSNVYNDCFTGEIGVTKLAVKYSLSGVNKFEDLIKSSDEGNKLSEKSDGEDEEVASSESKRTKAEGKISKNKVCLDRHYNGHADQSM